MGHLIQFPLSQEILIAVLGASILSQRALVWLLTRKKVFQEIYELSPGSHQKKVGTPSFGGVAFILVFLIALFLSGLIKDPLVLKCAVLTLAYAGIGAVDDLLSKLKGKNEGVTPKQKFMLELSIAVLWLYWFSLSQSPLTLFDFILYTVTIVGASNATNLTDGLDGLLAGLSLITFTGLALLLQNLGALPLAQSAMLLATAILGFLWLNKHPAKIFMGDTGSLAIGAAAAAYAIAYGNPWVLFPLGAVYIIETLSVIAQVLVYKKTKKRLFKMAPIHHHVELSGASEWQTVLLFWCIAAAIAIPYLLWVLP